MGAFMAVIYHSGGDPAVHQRKALLFKAGHMFFLESSKGDQ